MNRLIAILLFVPLTAFADPAREEREFSLTTEYFDWAAKGMNHYPFTVDLNKIDEGISGEYSYSWSIGWPQTRHVVQAACLGNYDQVLLGWWMGQDRGARVAAIAVYYCTSNSEPGGSNYPQFGRDTKRFKDTEAQERAEEIAFVRSHLPYFRNWLRSLVLDSLPNESEFLKRLNRKTNKGTSGQLATPPRVGD